MVSIDLFGNNLMSCFNRIVPEQFELFQDICSRTTLFKVDLFRKKLCCFNRFVQDKVSCFNICVPEQFDCFNRLVPEQDVLFQSVCSRQSEFQSMCSGTI